MTRTTPLLIGLVLISSVACGPATRPGSPPPNQPERTRQVKTLTIGVLGEPTTFGEIGVAVATAGGDRHIRHLAHDYLSVEDERQTWHPQLATEMISVDRGTWRVNPDGTMDTTWKIHPNVRWHDGQPFAAEDLLFAFTVYKDPAIATRVRGGLNLMESARVIDASTLEVHWIQPYFAANEATGLYPLPRHILEPLYQADKDAFVKSPWFSTEFVGLGPYRLVRWEPGAHMEFTRFAAYYRGTPPLDTVIMRWLGDATAMIANIMAGAVDAMLPVGVRLEEALDLKGRWEGTGNQVVADLSGRLRHVEIQHRPEHARPSNGLTNATVRRALYHAIDRRSLVDLMNPGLNADPADSWLPPGHELRTGLEPAIPQFAHDVARAQQLLAQAGWNRGPDGSLTTGTGELFQLRLWNTPSSAADREMNALADSWKSVGVLTELYLIPTALTSDRQHRATLPGAGLTGVPYGDFWVDRLHSRNMTGEANRWVGSNRGGYNNPKVDELLDRLVVTISPAERLVLHRQLLHEQLGDVALMPLYYDLDPTLTLKGVRGVTTPRGAVNLANVLAWDKD
jgi:peptide/nickel transport system substrate-binding protein